MSYTWDELTQSLGLAEVVDSKFSSHVLGSLITWEPGSEGEHLSSKQVFQEKRVEAALSSLTLTQKSQSTSSLVHCCSDSGQSLSRFQSRRNVLSH